MSCESFPLATKAEQNPAIQLFGLRLFVDQSPAEFLVELLLLIHSEKRVGDAGTQFDSPLPDAITLRDWPPPKTLSYAPKARLNLKLFAFMGISRLETRHETHREHYKEVLEHLRKNIELSDAGSKHDILRTLENLFLGFQGAGSGRTWCAQSFVPVCPGLLAGETIWNETAARGNPPQAWMEVLRRKDRYLTMNQHRFLARGGELLYLQICNALRQRPAVIEQWARTNQIELEAEEADPAGLHEELQRELHNLLNQAPKTLTEIAEFLDSGVEADTARATDTDDHGAPRFVSAGYCAAESWQEGYLFAVDLLRLCKANLDIIERLLLLELACALQVLRSLATQSARYSNQEKNVSWPGYRLAVSAPSEQNMAVKRISRHTAKVAERLIFHALREMPPPDKDTIMKEADRRYGSKLFTGMAKKIGMLVPRRGAGARFTLTEPLLRLLVITTVPIGGRLTYDRFKALVEARHGLVFDADGFARANEWSDGGGRAALGSNIDAWLQDMLLAAGMLIHLSDSCALVVNPAAKKGALQ